MISITYYGTEVKGKSVESGGERGRKAESA
jgi:hypothetical protein